MPNFNKTLSGILFQITTAFIETGAPLAFISPLLAQSQFRVLKFLLSGFCPSLFIIVLLCLTPCLPSWNHENSVATAIWMVPFQLFNYSAPGTFLPILYQSNPDLILRRSNSEERLRENWGEISHFSLCFLALNGRTLWEAHRHISTFPSLSSALASYSKNQNIVFLVNLSNK